MTQQPTHSDNDKDGYRPDIDGLRAVAVLAVLLATQGCVSTKKIDQILAQTQTQAERQAVTEQVLLKLAEQGNNFVADTMTNVEDGSTVGWAKAKRAIRTGENQPLLDKDGNAQFETTEACGKSKSSRELAGAITKGTIKLAGVGFNLATGELVPSSILEGVVVHVEGTGVSSTVNATWASAWGNAIAAEKTAIVAGMAELATRRGAAWAVKFTATSDGIVKVITSAGDVAGKVLNAVIVPTPAELAASGVTKLVQAVIGKADGTEQTVLAADTATSKAATECIGYSETGQ